MKLHFRLPVLFLIGTCLAEAALIRYDSRSTFESAYSNIVLETFESAAVGSGTFSVIASPLSASTNNSVFAAGSVRPGFSVGGVSQSLIALGQGIVTGSSKAVGHSSFVDNLQLLFAPGVQYAGFDYFLAAGLGMPLAGSLTIEVFGTSGSLGSYVLNTTGIQFFGVYSDADAITEILLSGANQTGSKFVDNVTLPGSNPIPEPGTWTLGLLGLGCLLGLRRRG
jgi:hypothetical protein